MFHCLWKANDRTFEEIQSFPIDKNNKNKLVKYEESNDWNVGDKLFHLLSNLWVSAQII